jgi:hypothetical protein
MAYEKKLWNGSYFNYDSASSSKSKFYSGHFDTPFMHGQKNDTFLYTFSDRSSVMFPSKAVYVCTIRKVYKK